MADATCEGMVGAMAHIRGLSSAQKTRVGLKYLDGGKRVLVRVFATRAELVAAVRVGGPGGWFSLYR